MIKKFRREFAMLISAAICAIAVIFPAPKPGLGFAERAMPPTGALANAEMLAEGDAVMAALHQQASAALASLQATSAIRP
jgi:hypothetical protein